MLEYPEATHCPVLTTSTSLENSTFQPCEPTERLQFTTDIQHIIQKAPSTRGKSVGPETWSHGLVARSTETISKDAAKAKYLRGHDISDRHTNAHSSTGSGAVRHVNLPAGRHLSIVPSERHPNDSSTFPNQGKGIDQQGDKQIRKKPRRQTIWVPSDDTTIFTIHPGIQSDARSQNDSLSKVDSQSDSRGRRQIKPLAAAPKRAPLQPMLKPLQESEDQQDMPGNGPGKKNLPPLTSAMSRENIHKDSRFRAKRVSLFGGASRSAGNQSDVLPFADPSHTLREQSKSTAKLDSSNEEPKKGAQPFQNSVIVKGQRNSMMSKRNTLYYGTTWKASVDPHISSSASQLPTTLITPVLRKVVSSKKQKYPILREDVERPEMFEDAWLNDQEASLAQCVNGLFEKINNRNYATGLGHGHLRRTLLSIYQGAECSLLHGRLKASLLYGCLGRPRESLDASSLKSDIGIRQKFISLWTGNYSLEMLSAAAEVVVGREALFDSPFPGSRHQCDDAHTIKIGKKNLETFLELCLLRNEDAPDAEQSSPAWCWRRTMLRSMMVIYLLDKAKQMRVISTDLYQASSTVKSSLAFLRELTALIHPSVGDIYRPLKPLGYHLHHTQYPLSEFSYCIENLATDLRDGVRLTRLVELLLYPLGLRTTLKEDVTTALPTGEVLTTMLEEGQSWVFSQHLKLPCTARAPKIYNVHVALGALRAVHGVSQVLENVSAADIVDGHREKTITLLWVILGNWGLESLVNFDELRKEIRRLRKADDIVSEDESDVEGDCSGMREVSQKLVHLLRAWSRSIARRNGLRVLNLTTSFADGRVFAGILNEYSPYLSGAVAIGFSGKKCQLDARLRAIGCSNSFASIFGRHERDRVFNQEFTIASLAFLASRLLGASKRGRAAAVIQRTYRRTRNRQILGRRCRLLSKAVLENRNKVLKAARVLQGAWRAHVEWKREHRIASTRPKSWNRDIDQIEATDENLNVDIWLI